MNKSNMFLRFKVKSHTAGIESKPTDEIFLSSCSFLLLLNSGWHCGVDVPKKPRRLGSGSEHDAKQICQLCTNKRQLDKTGKMKDRQYAGVIDIIERQRKRPKLYY